jgi:hypothetical protein
MRERRRKNLTSNIRKKVLRSGEINDFPKSVSNFVEERFTFKYHENKVLKSLKRIITHRKEKNIHFCVKNFRWKHGIKKDDERCTYRKE